MMVHLFMTDGNHRMFNRMKIADAHEVPRNGDVETLYMWAEYVGYFSRPQQFIFIPIGRIKEIHATRKAGEDWT